MYFQDSVCCLSPAVLHQKQSAQCCLSNLPDSHFDSFFFFASHSCNFILLLSRHWSVSRHWSTSFSPGLVSLAVRCLNTPRSAGGQTMNQSLWGTSELTDRHFNQKTIFKALLCPGLFIVIFICLLWWLIFWIFLYHSAHASYSPYLELGKGFSSWLWERQFISLKPKKASLKNLYSWRFFLRWWKDVII